MRRHPIHPALVGLAVAVSCASAPAAGGELRGLWVVRTGLASPAAVDRVVDEAHAGGFNTLLVQVRGRGDAFYVSDLVPRSRLLDAQPGGFDPLARLLERAHARGLAVHAWVNVLLAADFPFPLPPGHVVREHPEWLMVPKAAARAALGANRAALPGLVRDASRAIGDVEGYFLSPAAAEVHRHLEAVVRELLQRYAVEGLHLDFIRYPGPDFDYSRVALEGFRRFRGRGELASGPADDPEGWSVYRRGVLTRLAGELAQFARQTRPGVVVSAAVVPDEAQARHHRFQDWPDWMSRGILDAVCPMTYTPDTRLFRAQVERARSLAGPSVWAGVGSYRLSLDETLEKIRVAREAGAAGVVLFSHESFDAGDVRRLRREAFASGLAAAPTAAGAR